MPDSNAIKSGEAYVELLTRNNTKAGVAEANKDISQFGASGTASLTNVGKASLLANEAATKGEKAFDGFAFKVAKLAAVGAVAAKGFESAFSASLTNIQVDLTKAGERLDYFLERMGKVREKRAALADIGDAGQRKKGTAEAFNEELSTMMEIFPRLILAQAKLDQARKDTQKEVGGQKFDLSSIPIFGPIAKGVVDIQQTKLDQVKKEAKASLDALNNLADKTKEIDLQAADPTKSIASKASLDSLRALSDGFDAQRLSVSKTAEQMTVLNKQFEMLREFGPEAAGWIGKATAPLLADATKTSIFLAQYGAFKAKRDIDDEMYWKQRANMISVTGGTKGAFGANLGSGGFDYGGGGAWAGIGLTLKDILESELRKERIDYETLREIQRFSGGDTFGP